MDYIAYLHQDRGSDIGVSFPDFPGCVSAGKTLREAQRMAAEALALHIRGMIKDGEKIPPPSTLDDVANDPAREGAVVTLVPYVRPGDETVRFNVTAKESQLQAIDDLAREAGKSRSAYMVQAALRRRSG